MQDFPSSGQLWKSWQIKEAEKIMLEELKKQVYEANMLLPKASAGDVYLGKCKWH